MDEEIQKATHEPIYMWQPVVKGKDGRYVAVLSDDSLDRDDEIVGKSAIHKVMSNDGYTAILLNHKNDVLMQIGEWTNKRIEEIDGHTAFVAEPKFYMSNPNAQIIKGCMDEGAQYGVSIGAIPRASEIQKINGKNYKVYTDVELLEASFVAIPSNRHGRAMAVAKMFGETKEETKMSEDVIQNEEVIVEETITEEVVEKTITLKEYEENMNKAKTDYELISKELELSKMKITEQELKIKELSEMSVLKGNFICEETPDKDAAMSKALDEGQLPVMKKR